MEDIDGDGKTVLDGDCWESNVDLFHRRALDHGVTANDIYLGAEDLPMWYRYQL